jgi:hypothetical protein
MTLLSLASARKEPPCRRGVVSDRGTMRMDLPRARTRSDSMSAQAIIPAGSAVELSQIPASVREASGSAEISFAARDTDAGRPQAQTTSTKAIDVGCGHEAIDTRIPAKVIVALPNAKTAARNLWTWMWSGSIVA